MKKFLALLIAMMMVLSLAACGDDKDPAPSGDEGKTPSSNQQQEQPSGTPDEGDNSGPDVSGEWPDNEWTKLICKPSTGTISRHVYDEKYDRYLISMSDWSLEGAEAYLEELAAMGFVDKFTDKEPKLEENFSGNAYQAQIKNDSGCVVGVSFYPEKNSGQIIIEKADG